MGIPVVSTSILAPKSKNGTSSWAGLRCRMRGWPAPVSCP